MPASNHKVGSPINVWQSLANKFINQSTNLKVWWDQVGEIVRAKHDSLCDYIDSDIATKQNLADVTIGLIPDGTITQAKLADSLKEKLPAQYVANRPPTSGDNFADGHKVGDAWYIPAITLNNLIPTPTAINPANFTLQNATATASGSALTLTCGNGFDYASLIRAITPEAGESYVLFADVKLTSTSTLTSISLNDQVINNPVKDTVYHIGCIATAPTQMQIKAQASSASAINGATIVIDKLTIVNMTNDMMGVPFDKAGAEVYFQSNPAFLTQDFAGGRTRWYCTGDGVWQDSSQISKTVADKLGLSYVDANTEKAIDALSGLTVPVGTHIWYTGSVPPAGYLVENGANPNRATYPALCAKLIRNVGNPTINISTGVFTLANHGLATTDLICLSTTGALPTGLTVNTVMYAVIRVDANTFKLASSQANATAGTAIGLSGTQSGVHTIYHTPFGIGNGTTTFTLPDLTNEFIRGTTNTLNRIVGNKQASTGLYQWAYNVDMNLDAQIGSGSAYSGSSAPTASQPIYGIRPQNTAMLPCIKY